MGCSGNFEEGGKVRPLNQLRPSIITNDSNKDISYKNNYNNNNEDFNKNFIVNENIYNKKNNTTNILLNEVENYKKIMYEMHLKFRKLHGCSNELSLDEFLNKLAQEYAKDLINNPKHIYYNNYTYKGETLGENIEISEGKINPYEICNKWYKESENYKYNKNKFQKETVHFTQIVWKKTENVGFGFEMKDNIYIAVALYYPAGNIFNEFDNNVLKKINDKTK